MSPMRGILATCPAAVLVRMSNTIQSIQTFLNCRAALCTSFTDVFHFIKCLSSFPQFLVHYQQFLNSRILLRVFADEEYDVFNWNPTRSSNIHCHSWLKQNKEIQHYCIIAWHILSVVWFVGWATDMKHISWQKTATTIFEGSLLQTWSNSWKDGQLNCMYNVSDVKLHEFSIPATSTVHFTGMAKGIWKQSKPAGTAN